MSKKLILFLSVVAVVFIGLVVYQKSAIPETVSEGSKNTYGKLDSPVTLTEFVDFQCEGCYAYYPTVKQIKEKYKDKVKFQIKYFPIVSGHANALAAASAAQAAAKQGKFFEMHDMLFEFQKTWENDTNRNDIFLSYAKQIGLNIEQYQEDVASQETQSIIKADLAEVKKLGGTGTPTFVLNGQRIETPKNDIETFSKLLDEALKNGS